MKIDKYFHLYGRKDDVVFEEIEKPELKKTGKWIKARYVLTSDPVQYVWNCSECGKSVNGYSAVVLTDYCPNCGSYNGGEGRNESIH